MKPWLRYGGEEKLYQDLRCAKILEPIFVSLWEHREIELLDSTSPWCDQLSRGILSRRGGRSAAPVDQVFQELGRSERFAADFG